MVKYKNYLKSQKAFTLIELMIVVAIIGIIASIAYPSYQDSVRRSRRANAKGVLMNFANAMERYYTVNSTYCDAGGAGGGSTCGTGTNDTGTPSVFSATSPLNVSAADAYYNLTIKAADANSFNLLATATGSQLGDGNLEINSTESRGRWDRNADGDTADVNEGSWN